MHEPHGLQLKKWHSSELFWLHVSVVDFTIVSDKQQFAKNKNKIFLIIPVKLDLNQVSRNVKICIVWVLKNIYIYTYNVIDLNFKSTIFFIIFRWVCGFLATSLLAYCMKYFGIILLRSALCKSSLERYNSYM